MLAGGQLLRTERLFNCRPVTYFDEVYGLPETVTAGQHSVAIKFQAKPGQTAGPVFGLKVTSDPARFPSYLFC